MIQSECGKAGLFAHQNGLRLSFHVPRDITLGALHNDGVLAAVFEVEARAEILRWMGFQGWHPYGLAINIHAGSKKAGLMRVLHSFRRLSDEAREWVTVENDEMSYSIEDLMMLAEHLPIVLNVHHQWIHTGQYIDYNHPSLATLIASWRDVRPKLHYSLPPQGLMGSSLLSERPILEQCLTHHTKFELNEHAEVAWNQPMNKYILNFAHSFDIMCEFKNRNQEVLKLL